MGILLGRLVPAPAALLIPPEMGICCIPAMSHELLLCCQCRFDIQGNGHCAYTNSHRISSDRCSETKFSICSHLQRHSSEVQKDPEILNST